MSSSVNLCVLIGNLGKDPELAYTASGTAKCRFSLATTEKFDKAGVAQEKTEWHNIVVWGKQAENVAKFLAKGRQVYIEGKIQTRSWDDEKTGQRRYITEINAYKVKFLGGPGVANGTGDDSGSGGGSDDGVDPGDGQGDKPSQSTKPKRQQNW
jgi:single-strand DNA-binding protein